MRLLLDLPLLAPVTLAAAVVFIPRRRAHPLPTGVCARPSPPPPPPPPCREFVEPLGVAHFNVEGTIEFSSMLFVPGMAPFDQNQGPAKSRNIRLYVKRVFISGACLAWWLAPGWVVVLNTFVEHIC